MTVQLDTEEVREIIWLLKDKIELDKRLYRDERSKQIFGWKIEFWENIIDKLSLED